MRLRPAPFAFFQAAPVVDSVSTFDTDCTTAKSAWTLGNGVCAEVTAPVSAARVLRRVQLVNGAGLVVDSVDVTTSPQTVTFTLPTAATFNFFGVTIDNRGTWRVQLVDTADASVRAYASITVRDPDANKKVADLQITKFALGDPFAAAGSTYQSQIWLFNAGPDDAANVRFTDQTPSNTTFLSLTQTGGPTFNCTTPAVGGAGSTVCTAASLAKDASASFVVTYTVSGNLASGAAVSSTASASSDATDTYSDTNTSTNNTTADNPTSPACTLTCPNNVVVTAAAGQPGAAVTFPATAAGAACGNTTTSPASGSFFSIGTSVVTTSTESGQSCSFTVTVNPAVDTTDPLIDCPDDFAVSESSPAANSAVVNYTVMASDDSGSVSVNCEPPSGSTFPAGTTQVNCTATDAAGNSASCSFNVTVNQSGCALDANSAPPTPNVASLPSITRACSVTLLPTDDPRATDACGSTIIGTTPDRTFDAPGTYNVVWTYTDGAGKSTTQNQTVTILPDNSAPVPDAATLPTVTGECTASITGDPPTATDDCGGSGLVGVALDPLTYNTPGTHTVRWRFTDPAGNSTIQNQTVVVTDTHAPTVTLNGPSSVTVECHTSYTDAGATASDNCSPAPTPTANSNVNVDVPGNYTVVWSVTDGGGNTATVTRNVTVVDTTKPVIALNGANPFTVECHTSFTDPGATATDSCDTSVLVNVSGAVNADVVGTYELTYTATDDSGNAAVAVKRTVNVVDTTKPVITLNGPASLDVLLHSTYVDAGATATDSCAGAVPVTATSTVDTHAIGTYTVTYTATDPSSNAAIPVVRTVRVIYDFSGFFSPINNSVINQVNAGRSVPVKFSLNGNQGLNIFAAGAPFTQQVTCGQNNVSDLQETGTAGNSSLAYNASSDQYIYTWKTESSWAGTCRVLSVKLNDGMTYTATFKFK